MPPKKKASDIVADDEDDLKSMLKNIEKRIGESEEIR